MNPQRKTTRIMAAIDMYSNLPSPSLSGAEGSSGVGGVGGVGGVTTGSIDVPFGALGLRASFIILSE